MPLMTVKGGTRWRAAGAPAPAPAPPPAEGGPTLLSAPVLIDYEGNGTIYTVQYAEWENQHPIKLTGTRGAGDNPADYQLYLGPSASSTPDEYADGHHFITYTGMNSPGICLVTGYNATTKIATVEWNSVDRNPGLGVTWKLFHDYPVQRQFRWYRDGVLIPNLRSDVYTRQNADAGKTIQVAELGGFIPANTSPTAIVVPAVTTSALSAGVAIPGGTTDADLVGADDFVYVGSFQIPSTYPNATGYYTESWCRGVSVIPAAYASGGQKTLLTVGKTAGTFAQVLIPADGALRTPDTVPLWSNLPTATAVLPAQGGGQPGMSGIGVNLAITDGLDNANGTKTGRAQHIPGTTKFLFTVYSEYSNQGVSLTYRANLDFSGTPEGPVIVMDPVKSNNSRGFAGGGCKIPAALQAALGGDLIVSNQLSSIVSNTSDGPALLAFNSSGFDAAYAKSEAGTARAGTSTTIQLASGATGTTSNYYDGFWIKVSGNALAYRVASYNPATKTITADFGTDSAWASTPNSSSTYRLYPPLAGNSLAYYGVDEFAPTVGSVANPFYTNANVIHGAVLPSGTRSALCMGAGAQGPFLYGINGRPDNGQAMRIYDPNNPSGTGQHQSASTEDSGFKVWAYDTDDLLDVISGSVDPNEVRPYGVFKFLAPYGDLLMPVGGSANSFAYDQETARLYIIQSAPNSSQTMVCHVYTITSASTEAI